MSRPRASARLSLLIGVPLLVLGLVAGVLALRPAGPVALPTPADPVPGRLRSAQEWLASFDQQWGDGVPDRLSHSRDSWDHYTLSYFVDALTAAYLASGNRAYLGRAVDMVANVVNAARPSISLPGSQYHDSYLGWASSRQGGSEVPLYESYFWRYATTVLAVIRDTPETYGDPSFRVPYERLLAFAERNVMEKWYTRGPDDTIFRSRTHMASHWALIALNLSRITTEPARRAVDRKVLEDISQGLPNYPSSLRQQLEPNPSKPEAYFWDDVWGSRSPPGQDVSHGNGVIAFVVAAHDAGAIWSDEDVRRFVALFQEVVWPQPGPGAEFLDGSGRGNGWFSDGFVKLGRYDPALQRRLEFHQPANSQFYANGALNAALLACGSARGTVPPSPASRQLVIPQPPEPEPPACRQRQR